MGKKFDSADVVRQLMAAESEADAHRIVEATPELGDDRNWRPLDGRETNYNVTTNQQASGPKAATELMTNMVDALLLRACRQKGIDPRDPKKAPKNMHEAVERFFGYPAGRLINAETDKMLADFASKNLLVGITGARTKSDGYPCYTFADNGEGQHPEEFEDTFLSLSKGNKKDIAFVQGKFNMGSSGVLSYCGRRWYKLIVSRKFDKKRPWGWTLMRRRPGNGMPVAEYFKLGGAKGAIPTFDDDMLFPFNTGDGTRYAGFSLETGTIVKLYDFQVGTKFLSFRGAREALNENLVETILPFRILDFRQLPKTKKAKEAAKKRGGDRALGIDARPFYGMEYLLLRAHAADIDAQAQDVPEHEQDDPEEPEPLEDRGPAAEGGKIQVETIEDPELGIIEVTAIPLKRKLPNWLKQASTNNRVFHAVNGQVQYKQTRGFLTNCGLSALKDRVIIVVDASRLSYGAHNDVWKSDRESVRETQVGEIYLQRVRSAIEKSEALKELQAKVAKEELTLIKDEQSNEIFEKLVHADRTLANLLGGRDPAILLKGEPGDSGASRERKFQGKYSPTFVRLEGKTREAGLVIPINRSRPFAALTDAENGYLIREDNRGRLHISDENLRSKFVIRQSLRDGRLVVFLQPMVDRVKPGDTFSCDVGLHDDAMPAAVTDKLSIVIAEEAAEVEPKPQREKPPKKKEEGDEGAVGLPEYILLTKDGRPIPGHPTQKWPDDVDAFDDHDGGLIVDLGEGHRVYKINYDNSYHLKYRQQQRGDVARDAVSQKYIIGMRILMLGFEHALRNIAKSNGVAAMLSEHADDIRRLSAKGAAATILAVSDHLPKLMEPLGIGQEPE